MKLTDFVECNSFLSKMRGLMFRLKPQILVMIFKSEVYVPLHMWFVFFPIDVLFLDSNKKVVEIKENFKPFSIYDPINKAKYIIELPKGFVHQNKIILNQEIIF